MILVTGAGGTVGSELVKALSAAGAKFRAAYNSPAKVELARRNGLDADAIDYAKPETVAAALAGADGQAFSFAKVHRPVERDIEASGLGWTFLRPNGFMQNVPNFFAATIKSQGAFYLPSRDCRISHVDVRDIAAVAVKALTEPGHEPFCAGGRAAISRGATGNPAPGDAGSKSRRRGPIRRTPATTPENRTRQWAARRRRSTRCPSNRSGSKPDRQG